MNRIERDNLSLLAEKVIERKVKRSGPKIESERLFL